MTGLRRGLPSAGSETRHRPCSKRSRIRRRKHLLSHHTKPQGAAGPCPREQQDNHSCISRVTCSWKLPRATHPGLSLGLPVRRGRERQPGREQWLVLLGHSPAPSSPTRKHYGEIPSALNTPPHVESKVHQVLQEARGHPPSSRIEIKTIGVLKHAKLFSQTHGGQQVLEEFLDSHAFCFIVLSPHPFLSSPPPLKSISLPPLSSLSISPFLPQGP